jgi:hypothetical protein
MKKAAWFIECLEARSPERLLLFSTATASVKSLGSIVDQDIEPSTRHPDNHSANVVLTTAAQPEHISGCPEVCTYYSESLLPKSL